MPRIFQGLLLAGAVLALALAGAAAPGATAAGTASPPAGPAGSRFNFAFSGYEPGERVDAWVTSPAGRSLPRYPSVEADDDGRIVWSFDIPPEGPAGVWTAAARGIRSGVTDSASFTVTSASAPAPAQGVEPASGPAGSSFSFRASGFEPGERVGAWLVQPDGKSRELGDEVFWEFADDGGTLAWVWASPADAPAGAWLAVAQGADSRYQARIPFTVTAGGAPAPARSISPASGGPGTTFSIVVGGMAPGERVGTWLNRPDGSRQDSQTPWVIADAAGEARWQWTAPADAPAGTWQAVTRGTDSGAEAVLGFTLSGTAAPAPPPAGVSGSVSPDRGPPGTTFVFSVRGFAPGETIVYFVENPDRRPQEQRTTVVADGGGAASFSYTPPVDPATKAGAWRMSAYGETSRSELVIGFAVTEPEARPGSVSPATGGPGTLFSFRAEGFARKEDVGTWVNGPGGKVYEGPRGTRASEAGVAEWQWAAPADAPAGAYQMVARGEDTEVLILIDFRVERDAPPPGPPTSVSPERGPPGTTFTFTAGGFKAGERVGYWMDAPDGTIYGFDEEATANAEGVITVAVAFPADASLPRGTWTFVARSSQSDDVINDVTHQIRFVLE